MFIEKTSRDFDSDIKRLRGEECRVLWRSLMKFLRSNNYLDTSTYDGEGAEIGDAI